MRISDWSSDVCSSDLNIETIRAYLPSFKRLGLLYNSGEKNSVLKRDELAALTDELGFQLIAREIPLGDDGEPRAEQIAPQLAELEAAGVDFLYLGSSSFLRKHRDIDRKRLRLNSSH